MTLDHTPELQGHCPVAYFALSQPMKGDPQFSSTHDGKVYHFVNEEVKTEFDRNPDKYIPVYGGRCAFGMSIDKEFEACPTNFKIINGKLHLFLKNDETDALHWWHRDRQLEFHSFQAAL
ncbi:MAG: YHS domain-containing (seleno)protein [Planctomycetaceae bacterium]